MTFISEQIATLRGWGIPTTALDDTALTAIVNESLSEFSRYRPCIKTKTFDTVAGQQKYSWTEIGDTNGLTVQSAFWGAYSGIGPWSVANIMSASGIAIEAGDWNFPSLRQIDQIKSAAFAAAFDGKWLQEDPVGGDLYLSPVPAESGSTVLVLYAAKHADTSSIRASDKDIYSDLIMYRACSRIAMNIALLPNSIKTTETQVENDKQCAFWDKKSKEHRKSFIDKCQQGFAPAGRS